MKTMNSKCRAVVLMEAVIVLPLLIMILFGVMEYGWMFLTIQEVKNAARNGVRVGVTADATDADIRAQITASMNAARLGGSGYTVTISADPASLVPGDPLTVEVGLPYQAVSLLKMPMFPVPASVRGSVTMAKEGP